jgi:hypothetical protein
LNQRPQKQDAPPLTPQVTALRSMREVRHREVNMKKLTAILALFALVAMSSAAMAGRVTAWAS